MLLRLYRCYNLFFYSDDMSHTIAYNSKSHVQDYFSMPKFDFGLACRNNQTNLNKPSYNAINIANVQFKPIPFDDIRYVLAEPTFLRTYFKIAFKLKLKFNIRIISFIF